jgi:hypothetical protein
MQIEVDHTRRRQFLRVRDRVSVRYPGDETVTCVIPSHEGHGEELVADELLVEDGPLAFSYRGSCGYGSTFAYRGSENHADVRTDLLLSEPPETEHVRRLYEEERAAHGSMILFAAATGLRPSELFALEHRDIDRVAGDEIANLAADGLLPIGRGIDVGVNTRVGSVGHAGSTVT